MAEKWGADVIRDSDGTVLSDEITHAGYGIYSTICIIRDHNAWAKENQDKLQQTFLCTPPQVAESDTLTIGLMDSFWYTTIRKHLKYPSSVPVPMDYNGGFFSDYRN